MNFILQDLFYGNIAPLDQLCVNTPEYRELRQATLQKYEHFSHVLEQLDSKLPPELDVVLEGQADCAAQETEQAFCDGFRLGARIILEILQA
ncbi:MAG: hypothetical protein J6J43_04440 [Oscillospiraceae bacterium]|nr:hypothetical protein [Oscillospiraceae bacterium]